MILWVIMFWVYLKRDVLTVFTEQSNCYDVFYYVDNDIWAISSSLYDLVEPLKGKNSQ